MMSIQNNCGSLILIVCVALVTSLPPYTALLHPKDASMHSFTVVCVALLIIYTGVRIWLSLRQSHHVLMHRDQVPADFATVISLANHQKAADYTIAKGQVERIAILWSVALLGWWTFGGGLTWLSTTVNTPALDAPITDIVLVLAWYVIGMVLALPLSIYRTFSIDARFGFNRTTPLLFARDRLVGLLVTIIIGAPMVWIVLWLLSVSGSWWWVWAWGVMTLAQLIGMWLYPVVIAPLFNRFTPLVAGEFFQATQALLHQTGFAHSKVFVMDASRRSALANAYFTGFGRNKRVVFYDTLLEKLTPNQATAVLAHEIGHYKHRDILKIIVASTVMTLVGFGVMAWLIAQPWFLPALGITAEGVGPALIACVLIAPVFTFVFDPLQSVWSRSIEFAADAFAVRYTSADDMSGALIAIYRDNAGTLTPDPIYAAVYYSHPPAAERIAHMRSLT
jgi:STE24 endopeptidase